MIRSDEEFRNEVFRRSGNYMMQRRKKRKKIVLTCVPLVLVCVILGSASFLSGGFYKESEISGSNIEGSGSTVPETAGNPSEPKKQESTISVKITISGAEDIYYSSNDLSQYQELSCMLGELIESGKESAGGVNFAGGMEIDNNGNDGKTQPESKPTEIPETVHETVYIVELFDENGFVKEYELHEGKGYIQSEDGRQFEVSASEIRKILDCIEQYRSES